MDEDTKSCNEKNIFLKGLTSWFENVIILTLNLIALSLLFPFIKSFFIVLIMLCAISLSFTFYYLRLKKRGRKRLKWLILTLCLTAITIIWALIGPIIVVKRPIYVYFSESYNPSKSRFVSLIPEDEQSGSLLIIAGPLRKHVFPLWRIFLNKDIRRLRRVKYGDSSFIVFPLTSAYTKDEVGVSSGIKARTIFIPFVSPAIYINLDRLEDRDEKECKHALAYNCDFLSYKYVITRTLPPWQAVYTSKPSIDDIRYAAILDDALTTSSLESTGEAISKLDRASSLAPSEIEKARVYCLLGKLAECCLVGNIGVTQSLALYQNAYSIMRVEDNTRRKTLFTRTPVENWIYNVLMKRFTVYGELFKEQILFLSNLLKLSTDDHIHNPAQANIKESEEEFVLQLRDRLEKKVPFSDIISDLIRFYRDYQTEQDFFSNEKKRMKNLSLDEFLSEAKDLSISFTPRARLFVDLGISVILTEGFLHQMHSYAKALELGQLLEYRSNEEHLQKLQALRHLATVFPEPYRCGYLEKLDSIENVICLYTFSKYVSYEAISGLWDKVFKSPPFQDFKKMREMLFSMLLGLRVGGKEEAFKYSNYPVAHSVDCFEWWKTEYLDWFLYNSVKMMMKLNENKNEMNRKYLDLNEIKSIVDLRQMQRDDGGRGRIFMPGLVMLAIVTEEGHSSFHKIISSELEKSLKVSYLEIVK